MTANKALISVDPEELRFQVELEKQSYCTLKVSNTTEHHVAFKVKTTSPKKYFVRPNTGVIHPWDSCIIRVTLQAQRTFPPDMQCRDKFLLQSTIISRDIGVDDLPADTFNKESGRVLEECKLRVVYLSPHSVKGSSEDEPLKSSKQSIQNEHGSTSIDDNQAVQRLKEERDAAVQQTQQLQQELEMLKRQRHRRSKPGFSLKFAILFAFIGIGIGFLLDLSSSSPALE
ncbi:Vesicle-associated protein 2-1 [Dionaea muscipula]